MKRILIGIIVLSVILAIAAWFAFATGVRTQYYDALQEETDTYIEAAFLPGAANNPIRGELNRMLGESLSEEVTDAQRLERARRGLVLIDELELQIDVIGETKGTLEERLSTLESDLKYTPSFLTGERGEVRDHASRLYAIADDIRGLSYRANYHTAQIFNRIIADDGVLSPSHIEALNEQIPQVEEQFNERSNLYAELENRESELDILFASLKNSTAWSPSALFR